MADKNFIFHQKSEVGKEVYELEILNLKGKCLKNIDPCRSDRGQLSITLVVGGTQTTPLSATKTRTSDTFISLEKLSFRFS